MPLRRELALDVAAIVLFAAIGRRSHHESGAIAGSAVVAAPFVAGWLAGGALVRLEARSRSATRSSIVPWRSARHSPRTTTTTSDSPRCSFRQVQPRQTGHAGSP
jgi:hypothetical protein